MRSWACLTNLASTPWFTTMKKPCLRQASLTSLEASWVARVSPERKPCRSIRGTGSSLGSIEHGFSSSGHTNCWGMLVWWLRNEASKTSGCFFCSSWMCW
uniref:Uncharacterized protein n=1 Tax=Opuntia streptacantha TaxID=393608 RepID=A0A7C9A0K5_OPUST